MEYVLEACVDSVESAIAAQQGGAKRVELCGNLIIGGTSPGKALFQAVRKYTDLEIRVLLRPRFGDFCYDEYEFEIMKEDVQMYRELGADGIVTGILLPDGRLDSVRMGELIREAGNADVALHRAFDVCSDPYETLEGAVDLGIRTILTSGQKNSAWEGRELLRELVRRSDGRIADPGRSGRFAGNDRKAGSVYRGAGLSYVRKSHAGKQDAVPARRCEHGISGIQRI